MVNPWERSTKIMNNPQYSPMVEDFNNDSLIASKYRASPTANSKSKHLSSKPKMFTIFIGGLRGDITKDIITHYFSQYGHIWNLVLKKKSMKANAGFATFKVSDYELFQNIVNQEHYILGREITCRPFFSGQDKDKYLKHLQLSRLFIKNIPRNYSDDLLKILFQNYGEVTSIYSIKDSKGLPRGFGFVNYRNAEDAQRLA